MNRITSKPATSNLNSLTIEGANPDSLHEFLKGKPAEARIREKDGVLFCRQVRKGSSLAHAGEFLT